MGKRVQLAPGGLEVCPWRQDSHRCGNGSEPNLFQLLRDPFPEGQSWWHHSLFGPDDRNYEPRGGSRYEHIIPQATAQLRQGRKRPIQWLGKLGRALQLRNRPD